MTTRMGIIERYSGTAAQFAAFTTVVAPGSEYWVYDTNTIYRTYDGTTWVRERNLNEFGGVYENQNIAVADTARRFATTTTRLRDVVIQVSGNAQLFGNAANQRYQVDAGRWVGFTRVDVSTLYFKNAVAGANGTVNIIGVEE